MTGSLVRANCVAPLGDAVTLEGLHEFAKELVCDEGSPLAVTFTEASAAEQVAQDLDKFLGARYEVLLETHLVRAGFVKKSGDVVEEKLESLIS